MLKWLRDVVLVPCIIAFLFMVWGAWYTGVKWHSPFSAVWLKAVLGAPIPMWMFLASLLSLVVILPRWARTFHKKPKLHIAISPDSTRWKLWERIDENVMQVTAEGKFKTSNTVGVLVLIEAYLEGTRSHFHLEKPINIFPGEVTDGFVPIQVSPVLAEEGNTVHAALCFKDVEGNEYKTEKLYFTSIDS